VVHTPEVTMLTTLLVLAGCGTEVYLNDQRGTEPEAEVVAPCVELDWYADADGDGYGHGIAFTSCDAPDGTSAEAGDCDDDDDAIHPAGTETCNDVDDDCDGALDGADSDLALLDETAALLVTFCWPDEDCGSVAWPLQPDGTWALGDYTGVWTWDECTGALAMTGGNTWYTGTTADGLSFTGTMYSDNNQQSGTWTAAWEPS
jgi:hypothetical protein